MKISAVSSRIKQRRDSQMLGILITKSTKNFAREKDVYTIFLLSACLYQHIYLFNSNQFLYNLNKLREKQHSIMKNFQRAQQDNDDWQWQSIPESKPSKNNRSTSENFFLKTQLKPQIGKGKKIQEQIIHQSNQQRRAGSKQNQYRKVSTSLNQESNNFNRTKTFNQRFMKKKNHFENYDENHNKKSPLNLEQAFKLNYSKAYQKKKKLLPKQQKDIQYPEASDHLPHFAAINVKQNRNLIGQSSRSKTFKVINRQNEQQEIKEQQSKTRLKSLVKPRQQTLSSRKKASPTIIKTSLNSKAQLESKKQQTPVNQTDQEILLRFRSRFESPQPQFNIALVLKLIVYLVVFIIVAGLFVMLIARMKDQPFCDNDVQTIKSGYPQQQNKSVFDYLLNSLKVQKKCEKCPQFANCDSGQFYCKCGYVKSGKNQCVKDASQKRHITQFVENLINHLGVQKGKYYCQSKDAKYSMASNQIQEKFRKQYSQSCNYFDKLDLLLQQIQNQVSSFKLSGEKTLVYQAKYPIMSIECRSQIFIKDNIFALTIGLITSLYILYKMRKVFRRCKFNRKAKAIFKSVQDKLRLNQKQMDQDEIYDICAQDGDDGVHIMKQIDQLLKKDKSVRRFTRMQNGHYKTFWEWSRDSKK